MAMFGSIFIPMEFGVGITRETGKLLLERGHKKVMVIYDRGVKAAGVCDPIIESIQSAGIETVVYDDVVNDPTTTHIDEAGRIIRESGVDGLVAIGGGSTIDSAKAMNVLSRNDPPILDYCWPNQKPAVMGLPLYAIPTTSGTGSEVTWLSILVEPVGKQKRAVSGPHAAPTLAIIDPVVTLGMPAGITASTGCDAFSHAYEGVTGRIMNPVSNLLGLDAISRITKWLPIACAEPDNLQAREALMIASTFAGMSFTHTGCHVGHCIGHNVGTLYHVAHGAACAAALPEVAERIAPQRPDQTRDILKAMGLEAPEKDEELGAAIRQAIRQLFDSVGIKGLKSLDIPFDGLDELAERAVDDSCMNCAPVRWTKEEMLETLEKAYI